MVADLKGNYADLKDINLYYEVHGEGEPLILLHGGLGATGMFGEVLPLLAEGRRVIAVDLQAHGRTADVDRPFSYEQMADDVADLIPHLSLDRADVMGYSLGGGKMSAQAVARMCAAPLGEVDGVRLIPPGRLREVSAPAFSGEDEIMGNPVTWALGFPVG